MVPKIYRDLSTLELPKRWDALIFRSGQSKSSGKGYFKRTPGFPRSLNRSEATMHPRGGSSFLCNQLSWQNEEN